MESELSLVVAHIHRLAPGTLLAADVLAGLRQVVTRRKQDEAQPHRARDRQQRPAQARGHRR